MRHRIAAGLLLITLAWSACGPHQEAATRPDSPTPVAPTPGAMAQCDLNNPAAPGADATAKPTHLVNVHRIGAKMISGALPEGPEAFDELRKMGVKTIISVDGAAPEVPMAESRGMRYVHIPITYAEATREQQLELARAVRDLPGPIYIHCHHGKHRSPAAAAAVAVVLGEATPDQGVAFMKTAGTAANYQGLYACVAGAVAASVLELDGAPHGFPSVRSPQGITGAMVDIDDAYDHLGLIRGAGWTTPQEHPDLVPSAEAGRLADQLRFCKDDPRVKGWAADFQTQLDAAIKHSTELEAALNAHAGRESLEAAWKPIVASCKDCHAAYRDVVSR